MKNSHSCESHSSPVGRLGGASGVALTPKQETFCHQYLIDLNARQAAIRAGYGTRSAHVSGSNNLKNKHVKARLQELMNGRQERIDTSADYVLQRLLDIDRLDIADILDDEGNLLPIRQWTEAWRLSVSAIDIAEAKTAQALIKKIKLPDKLKNLELIGKHINISAFRDRAELTGSNGRELIINVSNTQARDNLLALKESLSKR